MKLHLGLVGRVLLGSAVESLSSRFDFDGGADVKEVATRLGHSSVRITLDVYVAASSERDRAAAESVAAMYDIG